MKYPSGVDVVRHRYNRSIDEISMQSDAAIDFRGPNLATTFVHHSPDGRSLAESIEVNKLARLRSTMCLRVDEAQVLRKHEQSAGEDHACEDADEDRREHIAVSEQRYVEQGKSIAWTAFPKGEGNGCTVRVILVKRPKPERFHRPSGVRS